MVSASFMRREDVTASSTRLWPPVWQPHNYVEIFTEFNLDHYFLNSVFIVGSIVGLNLLFCSMVGYSLAKFEFPGRSLIFGFILSTIMVPFTAILVPLYLIVREFNWINTYQALIIPFSMSAFGIFLMRQFMLSIPDDEIWSARVDGASEWRIYRSVVLPQLKPALATLGMLTFMFHWNAYLWPLIVLTEQEKRTLPIILTWYATQHTSQLNLVMAASVLMVIPVLIIFALSQRWIVRGLTLTGTK
jgi:multiple sugar transport system permease protein